MKQQPETKTIALEEHSNEVKRWRTRAENAEERAAALIAWIAAHHDATPADSDIDLAVKVLHAVKLGRHVGQPAAKAQLTEGQDIHRPTPRSTPPTGGSPDARYALRGLERDIEGATSKAERKIMKRSTEADERCWQRGCTDADGIRLARGHKYKAHYTTHRGDEDE